ncbi:MAG TPA: glycosyl hydrolase [Terriglobia bacterium]|nr:glycosyl hydrolase [Terriglobia bacterium]
MSNRFRLLLAIILCSLVFVPGCGGGSSTPPPQPIGENLSVSSLTIYQDGTSGSVNVTITRPAGDSNAVTLTVTPALSSMNVSIQSPGTGNTGTVTFATGGPVPLPGQGLPLPLILSTPSGTYNMTIAASDGTTTASAPLTLTVGVAGVVGSGVDSTQGVKGRLQEAMSTSFQLASWADGFFDQFPSATTPLGILGPHHIRMQVLERDIAETSAGVWDFSYVDGMVNPIMSVTDHSPEYQIAKAPAYMYDASGNLLDPTFNAFGAYAADLVRYYNTPGGITDATSCNKSPCVSTPPNGVGRVDYWGIYNEPNINDEFSDNGEPNSPGAQNYVNMYNVVVPQMQAVDSTIKFVGVELADFSSEASNYIPTFVQNVTQRVDVLATHFYATCNQADTDQTLFDAITQFVPHVQYLYSQLQTKPALAGVPVWMTENNVNADYDAGGGISACNGTPFVLDKRGSSAFFAAWRPTAFSMFGKVGLQAMYHWDFAADAQYGEINASNAALQLGYWVDYWLGQYFPSNPDVTPTGADILQLGVSENSSVEILAARNGDGSVVVMVADHAVQTSTDNNGPGDPRVVALDLSALGTFSSASLLTIDKNTDVTNGPTAAPVTPAAHMTIQLGGYGVAFLKLIP